MIRHNLMEEQENKFEQHLNIHSHRGSTFFDLTINIQVHCLIINLKQCKTFACITSWHSLSVLLLKDIGGWGCWRRLCMVSHTKCVNDEQTPGCRRFYTRGNIFHTSITKRVDTADLNTNLWAYMAVYTWASTGK